MNNLSSQTKINNEQQGTFIIAGVCKDGVVIVADSRSVFEDVKGRIAAYFEGTLKLHVFNDIAFAVAGPVTFSKVYFDQIFEGFKSAQKVPVRIDSFLVKFFQYAKSKMILKDYDKMTKNDEFFVCGFLRNKPVILWHTFTQDSMFVKNGYYKTNVHELTYLPILENELSQSDIYNANLVLQRQANGYIIQENKNKLATSGGDLSSVGITQSITGNVKWFAKQDKNYFKNNADFMNSFLKGGIKMVYILKTDSVNLRQLLIKESY